MGGVVLLLRIFIFLFFGSSWVGGDETFVDACDVRARFSQSSKCGNNCWGIFHICLVCLDVTNL